ncbi:uncharacterized protein LOC111367120 [Olea europaea var. sylvestris]|uniref:uncharacterized protein LOC111367120 n=1 Tax=Olea europaea var. sylvestris TaxID=158386 RepID=UPI000C1CE8C1|nr:uncharacterized protein LOC111367120 [Olea europaea var. sylvestris]
MRRDDLLNQPCDIHNQGQGTNFLKDTRLQVKNMAQGATDIGKGAAQGAINLARGTATGAANIAFGAADAMKNTLGMNPADNTGPINCPGNMGSALVQTTQEAQSIQVISVFLHTYLGHKHDLITSKMIEL